jgi:hypothetical protein
MFETTFNKIPKLNARRTFVIDRHALVYPAIFEVVRKRMLRNNFSICIPANIVSKLGFASLYTWESIHLL